MIKSLYTRVVMTFLLSVIIGSIVAYALAVWVYSEKLNENTQALLLSFGKDMVRLYEAMSLDQAEAYVSGMKQLDSYQIRLYDETGLVQSFGGTSESAWSNISTERISQVLHGGIVQVNNGSLTPSLLGLPIQTQEGTKALFVKPQTPPSATFTKQWVASFLTIFFVTGSLFILFVSLFLVRPINKLTKATKRIAAGNFDVQLNIKQSGELGDLARSFESMSQDLQRLEKMRREFVANVSHELQSPLTSIAGYAQAMQQTNVDKQEQERYLAIISSEAKRMSNLTEGLLKLSQLESQAQQLQITTFRMDEQIRRVILALEPQWSSRKQQFDLQLENVYFSGDYELIHQVWTNIIGNSMKFSTDGSTITAQLVQDAQSVRVSITDRGVGIPKEDQKQIFDRFFKVDRSHQRKQGGSGVGLAIVKQIVILHNGTITVDSEPGKGTTLIVSLPKSSPHRK